MRGGRSGTTTSELESLQSGAEARPYRGRVVFDAQGRLQSSRPPLEDAARLEPHLRRLAHTARHAHELRDLVHITLYHWLEGGLWTQEVHFIPELDRVDAVLAPPLRCLGVPGDQQLLQMAMSHADEVILITESSPVDEPGPLVVYANAAFTRMTGYAVDEIVGRSPRILQGPQSEPEALARMGRALRAWEPIRIDVTNYRKDGTPFVVELDIRPVADASGWYTHWVSVQRDVTARRLNEARQLRLDRLETVGALAAGVAHDFNNLLVGILGNLELAKEHASPGSELALLLDDAEAAAIRSKAVTRQLSTFSHELEPGRATAARHDLRAVAREAVSFGLRGSGVTARWEESEDDGPIDVVISRTQVAQVLAQMALNAVESTKGRGQLDVRVDVPPADELFAELDPELRYARVELTVDGTDEPGPTGDAGGGPASPVGRPRGAGIGLAVAWTVAKWHRGDVRAEALPGGGWRARLHLPLAELRLASRTRAAAPPQAAPRSEVAPGPSKGRSLEGARVLWLEDEPAVRIVAERLCRRLGCTLELVWTGEAVLERLENDAAPPPDLVVLDLMIPEGLGGAETLVRMRRAGFDVPVLIASGYGVDGDDLDLAGLDPVARLPKPFGLQDLEAAMHHLRARPPGSPQFI